MANKDVEMSGGEGAQQQQQQQQAPLVIGLSLPQLQRKKVVVTD